MLKSWKGLKRKCLPVCSDCAASSRIALCSYRLCDTDILRGDWGTIGEDTFFGRELSMCFSGSHFRSQD